jgi:hypothetical protein
MYNRRRFFRFFRLNFYQGLGLVSGAAVGVGVKFGGRWDDEILKEVVRGVHSGFMTPEGREKRVSIFII